VLGMLGQWMGIHKMTKVIHQHGVVSPEAVSVGISESLWTPLTGMAVLVGAAVLWSLLRLRLWSIEHKISHG
jgi:biopolymer transport protein ExbB/TolQ